jgi:hypothetical protein
MYSRTQNENGSYNTRCLHCLMTVASSMVSAEILDKIEYGHMCVERALFELLAKSSGPARGQQSTSRLT